MKFELNKDIVFNSIAEKVIRSPDGSKWAVHLETSGQPEVREFDKVVFAHGYQTEPKMPTFEGQEGFEGVIMHSQQYRKPDGFKDKKVIIVGMANTASDIATDLAPHASKVYISHRRGVVIASRYRNGLPVDLSITWQRHKMSWLVQNHFPTLSRKLADTAVAFIVRRQWGKLDPAWRIQPSPSITSTLPAVSETLISLLRGEADFHGQDSKIQRSSLNRICRWRGARRCRRCDMRHWIHGRRFLHCAIRRERQQRGQWEENDAPLPKFVSTSVSRLNRIPQIQRIREVQWSWLRECDRDGSFQYMERCLTTAIG